jgi:histidine triad (HIT) family protein
MDCDFCKIARGEDRSARVLCAGERWVAFFPLNPATLGHTLIIPRTHVADLWQAEPNQGAELMVAVIKVGNAIKSALAAEGMNLISSAGSVAEQTVFHLHLHLIPRQHQDGFGPIWPHGRLYENAELDDVARRIRQACTS